MTPAKRRPATPASQGPTRTAPDVPIVAEPAPVPPAEAKDGTELLGPDGAPIVEQAPTETVRVHPAARATTPRPPRPLSLYPLPVWPD